MKKKTILASLAALFSLNALAENVISPQVFNSGAPTAPIHFSPFYDLTTGWANNDLYGAHAKGYLGQGTTTIFIDFFSHDPGQAPYPVMNIFDMYIQFMTHGQYAMSESVMVAPKSRYVGYDVADGFEKLPTKISLSSKGLNVVNLSLGASGTIPQAIPKLSGLAVISKAAGNNGQDIDAVISTGGLKGYKDDLSLALRKSPTTLFVGALDHNGSVNNKANISAYSNRAGTDPEFQKRYLMVGVEDTVTGLPGTSFAAPIVSGYAAILGSKFKNANPTQVTNQLLNTARKDTINGYDVKVHGRGEASLSRALAPVGLK